MTTQQLDFNQGLPPQVATIGVDASRANIPVGGGPPQAGVARWEGPIMLDAAVHSSRRNTDYPTD